MTRSNTRTILGHVLFLSWWFLCLIVYAVNSRVGYVQLFLFPEGLSLLPGVFTRLQPVRDLLNLLVALGGVLTFSLASLVFGWPFQPRGRPPLSQLVSAFLLGEILFSSILLITLTTYRLTPPITAAILAGGTVIGVAVMMYRRGQSRNRIPTSPLQSIKTTDSTRLSFLHAFILILTTFLSLARLGYDASAEYFSNAKIMALTHKAVFVYPTDSFVVSSFHPGILFTALIQLFGDQAARLLSWANGLAIVLLGVALAQRLSLSTRARTWFLTLALTSTFFVDLLGDGKVEILSTAPLLAALYWLLEGLKRPSKHIFFLVGLFFGFGMISRPYNIALVPLFVLIFLALHGYHQRGIHLKELKSVWWALPPLIALGLFHLWQNALWLGSPLAPLDYARSLQASDWQWQFNPSILKFIRLLYPLSVTFFHTPQSLGNISPLVVGSVPLLFSQIVRRETHLTPLAKHVTLAAALTLGAWIAFSFTVVEIRYVMFLWFLLFMPAAQLLAEASEHTPPLISAPLRLSATLLLLFISLRIVLITLTTYSPIDSNGRPHCYDVTICTFFEPVNEFASPGERVLALNAYRYYLRPDLFVQSSLSDETLSLLRLAQQSPETFWEQAFCRGFRDVIFEYNYAARHSHVGTLPPPSLSPPWLSVVQITHLPPQKYAVYRLTAAPSHTVNGGHCR